MASPPATDVSHRARIGSRAALVGVAVNALLATLKIVAGVLGHSYALIADGVESATDILSSLVVWGGMRIAAAPPDADHPYGHGRAESLAALVVALLLFAAAIGIAVESIREIRTPHLAPAPFTLAVLLGVIVVKEVLFRWVLGRAASIDSTAVRGDALHHRADALTSAAAFVGISVALLAGPGYESADDWAALLACGVIAWNGARLLRTAVGELMDEGPPLALEADVRRAAGAVAGVVALEKVRIRKSGIASLVDIHVEVDGDISVRRGHEIAHAVKDALLAANLGIVDVLVHVEPARRLNPSGP